MFLFSLEKRGLAPVHHQTLRLTDCCNRVKLWKATRSLWIGGSSMEGKLQTRWILRIASSTTTTTKLCLASIVAIFLEIIEHVKPLQFQKKSMLCLFVVWYCNCFPKLAIPWGRNPGWDSKCWSGPLSWQIAHQWNCSSRLQVMECEIWMLN